jgi:hypothetical protein
MLSTTLALAAIVIAGLARAAFTAVSIATTAAFDVVIVTVFASA